MCDLLITLWADRRETSVLKGELLEKVVPITVFLLELFHGSCGAVIVSLFNLHLQEPPEDDANIIEKILASKTVQEVRG